MIVLLQFAIYSIALAVFVLAGWLFDQVLRPWEQPWDKPRRRG